MTKELLSTLVAMGVLLGFVSCRDATQIVLEIRTPMQCGDEDSWRGVAVYVGKPGAELERQAPTLVTKDCGADGRIGSLVIAPSGEKNDEVGVVVVAGVQRNPEDCEANGYRGCVVARRAVRFVPHDELELEVELTPDCVNIGCDPAHSCYQGICAAAEPSVARTMPSAPVVRCGDNGVFCPTTGDVCCLTVDVEAGTTHGECRQGSLCQGIVLNCDDDSDCPRGGPNNQLAGVCALSFVAGPGPFTPASVALSACHVATTEGLGGSLGLGLCQERKACVDQTVPCRASAGEPNQLPGYFWCELAVQ